jgi:integrase
MTLEKARELALQDAAKVAQGEDPRVPESSAVTVREFSQRYLDEYAKVHKKASSAEEDQRMLDKYVLPPWGHLPVVHITPQDVQRMHHHHRRTPYQANRILALLSKFFHQAEVWGVREPRTNPTMYVKKYKEQRRERVLTGEEFAKLAEGLVESAGSETEGDRKAAAIIRLLIFTGARKSEIVKLRWEHVDFDTNTLRLPDSKTGRKVIHLNTHAAEILRKEYSEETEGWVFPGTWARHKPFAGLQRCWEKIVHKAGLDDVRIHDLRHHFGSMAAGGGLALPLIGALLGHRRSATTERYAHVQADPQKMAVERVGRLLEEKLRNGSKEA